MATTTFPAESAPGCRTFGDPHLRTDGDVLAVAHAADGSLWSVEEPGVARRWDPLTGGCSLSHALSDLETLWRFGPGAAVLASACDELSLWDPLSGNLLATIPQLCWVTALAFHPSGRAVATGHDDGTVRVWDLDTGEIQWKLGGAGPAVSALAFTAAGDRLAVAREDKRIGVWDVAGQTRLGVLEGHKDRVCDLAWHPDGRWLVSAAWDTTARVWDADSLQPVILLNSHATQVFAVAFSPDGRYLASSDSADAIHIWEFATKRTVRVLRGPATPARRLSFSGDGTRLASGGEGRIHLWSPAGGQLLSATPPGGTAAGAVSLSPDGARLVAAAGGGACVWDTRTGRSLLNLEEPSPVRSLAYSPDGTWIAGGTDGAIRIWDAATGRAVAACEGPKEPTTALAFSPDGQVLASAGSTGLSVWLWDPRTGEPVLLIPDALLGCTVEAVAFHPGGRRVIVGGIDPQTTEGSTGAVSLWDIVERCEVDTFSGGVTALAVDPSGRYLATGNIDYTLTVWDLETGQQVTVLSGHDDTVRGLAFTPDGRWLVSGGDDLTLRVWETAGWCERACHRLESQVKAVAVSADGRSVYTGNANGISYGWPATSLLGPG